MMDGLYLTEGVDYELSGACCAVEPGEYPLTIKGKRLFHDVLKVTWRIGQELSNTSSVSSETAALGDPIIIHASAEGGRGDYMYEVDYKNVSASDWTVLQDSDANDMITFLPPAAGTYDVLVKVKDSSGMTADKTFSVTVIAALENRSAISSTAVKLGTSVTVNASAAGGTEGYTYAVYYRKSTSSNWTRAQDFSANSTVKIKPGKALRYDILVKVKDGSGTTADRTFTLNVFETLKNTSTVSSDKVGFGGSVTVMTTSTGGLGDRTYAVYYKKSSSEKLVTLQKYSDSTVVSFKPASATTYDIMVKVKDSRNVIVKKTMTVNVTKLQNTSEIGSTSIRLGNTIDVFCSAVGSTEPYQYAVLYKKASSEKWTIRQNYSDNDIVVIKPGVRTTYDICVKVRDPFGNIARIYFIVTVR